MAFPDDPLQIRAEIALGADVAGDPASWSWTDISAYVRTADGARVTVNRGRRNDSGSSTPATAQFELDNDEGRFCTQNPMSPYFPLLKTNTPVKLSVSTDSGSSWSVRYSGYLSTLPTSWRGPGGSDSSVSVTADSVLRRLGKGGSRSPLRWTAPNLSSSGTCIEYWPMEDNEDATECASYFPDGIPMTAAGSIEMGASSPPSGSQATPQSDYAFMKANPPSLTGIVRPYASTGAWTVLGIFKVDAESIIDQVLIDCDITHGEGSTDPDQLRVQIDNNKLAMSVSQEDGTVLGTYPGATQTTAPNDGNWHSIAVTATQSGADVRFDFHYDGSAFGMTIANRTLGTIRKVAFPSTSITTAGQLLAVGHLAVYDDNLLDNSIGTYSDAMLSHLTAAGERVDLRLGRLEDESDLIHSIGAIPGEVEMLERVGSQADGTILAAAEDAAEADGGILYEPRDFADDSLTYLSRSAINVNAISTPAMTLTQDHFTVIEQGDDDYYLGTKVTVTGAGSSSTAAVEPIENEITLAQNVRFADRLPDLAGWALYQGTRPDYRYPRIRVLLHDATSQIAAWKTTELGDRILIPDPPPGVVNDIDAIIEGCSESFSQFEWSVDLFCSPASRYRIAKLDHTTYGRMDTAASRLVNAVTSSATTLDVETVEGAEWSTATGYDLGVGGERMTVTAVTGSFTDSFTRTVASGWGTSTSGHAWSITGGSASEYSVNGTRGIVAIAAVNSLRSVYITALPVANIDRTFTVRIPVLATGAAIQVRAAARWDVAANTYLTARVQAETDQTMTLQLMRVVAGSVTTLRSRTIVGLTHSTTADYRIRFKVQGSWLFAKVWNAASSEPTQWTDCAWDTAITAAGSWGIRTALTSGNTNTLPVSVQFDTDATTHPQAISVTRSVNTVVKAQAAGAPVGLFQPNYLGL
ncbi:hypothetical protein [Glycomyces lechevalierae]|uniref:Concanavalin A-like lectin/glucanases superfamily protein n=3 Tax=Bacteria TaxID=2 RepID=A0ABU2AIP6_9ACTN|nr:hypothetical protein [Glycomyces lechevalierae]MDR7336845.1 hypothetical protein [Glycomyces lechevalierae]